MFLLGLPTATFAGGLSYTTPVGKWNIPTGEGSGITYNAGDDQLHVIGDDGEWDRYTTSLEILGGNPLFNIEDPEGIAYIGNNRVIIAEERVQLAHEFYDVFYNRIGPENAFATYDFGVNADNIGQNIGLEGISYDAGTNSLWGVTEKGPQLVYQMLDLGGANTLTNPFDPAGLGLNDLSDIFLLSNSDFFDGTPSELNLLILSQESNKILEVTRDGTVVDSMDLAFLGNGNIEGLTIDHDGNLFLVGEITDDSNSSEVFKFAYIPEPSAALLFISAGLMTLLRRRRRNG